MYCTCILFNDLKVSIGDEVFIGLPGSFDAYKPKVIAVDGDFIAIIVIVTASTTSMRLIKFPYMPNIHSNLRNLLLFRCMPDDNATHTPMHLC